MFWVGKGHQSYGELELVPLLLLWPVNWTAEEEEAFNVRSRRRSMLQIRLCLVTVYATALHIVQSGAKLLPFSGQQPLLCLGS